MLFLLVVGITAQTTFPVTTTVISASAITSINILYLLEALLYNYSFTISFQVNYFHWFSNTWKETYKKSTTIPTYTWTTTTTNNNKNDDDIWNKLKVASPVVEVEQVNYKAIGPQFVIQTVVKASGTALTKSRLKKSKGFYLTRLYINLYGRQAANILFEIFLFFCSCGLIFIRFQSFFGSY